MRNGHLRHDGKINHHIRTRHRFPLRIKYSSGNGEFTGIVVVIIRTTREPECERSQE